MALREVDLVDADDLDGAFPPFSLAQVHGGAEEHLVGPGRLAGRRPRSAPGAC